MDGEMNIRVKEGCSEFNKYPFGQSTLIQSSPGGNRLVVSSDSRGDSEPVRGSNLSHVN